MKGTTDGAQDEPPKPELAEMPGSAGGQTIEFGPDGFPVAGGAPPKKAPATEPAGMDQTINFGPDGFPVEAPKKK